MPMFVKGTTLLGEAQKNNYAVPAFNTTNLEITQALFEAAKQARSPLWIQTTPSAIAYAGLNNLTALVSHMSSCRKVKTCIHLDHGKDFATVKKCVDLGYKSVMIDGSKLSYSKNIALTKKCSAYAHKKGASVEAELGAIGSDSEKFTDPLQAKDFVNKTGCDSLAVAIGTSHGAYKFKEKAELDFARLKEIREIVSVPLVLHGASASEPVLVSKANAYGAKIHGAKGVPDSQIKKAIKFGVSKVNIDTDLRLAFTAGVRAFLKKNPSDFDPRSYLFAGREEVKREALKKINLLK